MRSSRVSVWAVGLLVGLSGCAGVHRHGPVSVPDGMTTVEEAPSGLRGWWSRRFGGGYAPAVHSQPGAVPPAAAFPDSSGGGWGAVHQFARPPWVTRQPQRGPIFSLNGGAAAGNPKMSPAEINEAIARMTSGRRSDDQVLPARNLDEPRPDPAEADADADEASLLASPIGLPDALARAPGDDPEARRPDGEPVPSIPPGGAVLLGVRPADEPAAEAAPRLALAESGPKPEPKPEAEPEPNVEPASPREVQDDNLVRSAQLPPPPPIRPEPGSQAPAPAPKPADAPKVEDAPSLEPADAPKVETPTKPVEKPKVEAPKPEDAPKVEAPKPEDAPKAEEPAAAPKVEDAPKAEEPAEAPKAEEPVESSAVEEAPEPAETSPPPVPPAESAAPAPTVEEASGVEETETAPATMEEFTAVSPEPAPQVHAPAPTAQTQIFTAPIAPPMAPAPARAAHRWSFWNWKSSGRVAASPQAPASLPPAAFPTSYESVWARPLVPSPQATPQAGHVHASPQSATAAEKGSCWLVDRLKTRAHQFKAWKHEHICKHIENFKAALKGERCHDCERAVTPSPQAVPPPQARPTPQDLPVIGGSRFGMY